CARTAYFAMDYW
nr:immunoglobulin heavy chain junction region [Mus musculus]